ncbi:helix-turn-helix domain-containing protein [Clostridium tarantellae]|uniref:Cupin domain-containing protein n=1 Tax=Clostridium tarantellae TaxID=39493 RepID=A0A6I1MLS0_9CLOT|nr:XRE family transcriptional regulator [Clostridium tarantellae]MPQ43182.1 cupin domain-containing protein [Clostridium tarantellae]
MIKDVGKKIKELRLEKKLTLKELSNKTDFSIGFLSQLERGLTTIAIDSLQRIAKELAVDISYFIQPSKRNKKVIIRNYEREVFHVDNNQFIHYHLTNDIENKSFLPSLIEILPMKTKELIKSYPHEGEEFIYVLEGICTLSIDGEQHDLYPGDCAHYNSSSSHNWTNYTNKTVKIIAIHTPNRFKK